jgi:hypothetical protein
VSATHESIANAVAGVVTGLHLPGMTVTVRAVVYRTEDDPAALAIVTMGDERDAQYLTGGNVLREYEIVLTVTLAANQKIQTDIGDAKVVRERCRLALVPDDATPRPFMPTVPSVYDVVPVDLPAMDEGPFRANYSTARLGLVYRTSETIRGG